MQTAKTLIRLGRCPGWSESSLVAHAILLVLLCHGSYHVEWLCPCVWMFTNCKMLTYFFSWAGSNMFETKQFISWAEAIYFLSWSNLFLELKQFISCSTYELVQEASVLNILQSTLFSICFLAWLEQLLLWMHVLLNVKPLFCKMSHVTRKPVFGDFDQVRLKPACAATEAR